MVSGNDQTTKKASNGINGQNERKKGVSHRARKEGKKGN